MDAQGQVSISPSTELHIEKNATIYVPGIQVDSWAIHGKWDIVNYGDWIANNPVMNNTDSIHVQQQGDTIGGLQWTNFYKLTSNNPAWITLANTLTTDIQVRDTLKMIQGIINLNGQHIDLWLTGTLDENDTSYVFDNVSNGTIKSSANLNNPSNANPGNLWLEISGWGNMWMTEIARSNMEKIPWVSSFLNYTVTPANAPVGNVTVVLYYRPHNIQIGMWNPVEYDVYRNDWWTWLPTGWSSDILNDKVSSVLVDGFKDGLTIANMGDPLAVSIISFSADCEWWLTILNRMTASETDSNLFDIQKSSDGVNRYSAGTVPAAGNSNQILNYTFQDSTANDAIVYYRLVEHDNNGNTEAHSIIASNCIYPNIASLVAFPNPTTGKITIQIQSTIHQDMPLSVVDMSGKLVHEQEIYTIHGVVQHYVDLSHLADGIYALRAWDKTIKVVIAR